jgi:hypothetical protein
MKNEVIFSKQIIWSPSNDRHILIVKDNDAITGLNYCQGDDLSAFLEDYDEIDHDLTDFYNAVKNLLCLMGEIDLINEVIWAHHNYKTANDEREWRKQAYRGL